jgi:tetratricopeptide (TPR) repeat protein
MGMKGLAANYFHADRTDDAFRMIEESLALSRRVFGPEHPETIDAMNTLAIIHHVACRENQALAIFGEVLALYRKILGPEHPSTLTAMINLLQCYKNASLKDELCALREKTLALSRKINGQNHPVTRDLLFNLAASYLDKDRPGDALGLLSEVLEGDPEDALAVLRVVAIHLWFGQDGACETALRGVLEWARESEDADQLGLMPKVMCLRPPFDPEIVNPVIGWARTGLDRGQNQGVKPWRHLTLGMALFRGGFYADALPELAKAEDLARSSEETTRNRIIPTAANFRAMCLLRQGNAAGALAAFAAGEADMKPLPADAEEAVSAHHDDLILWLAHKEAREMLTGMAESVGSSTADEDERSGR